MKLSIDKQEYEKMRDQALVIDVRSWLEAKIFPCLPASINVHYQKLITNPEKYIKDQRQLVITYCNFGNRSGKAASNLRNRGYSQVFVLKGGINNYFSN